MKLNLTLFIAGSLACAATLTAVTATAVAVESKITILYDAFGNDAADTGSAELATVCGLAESVAKGDAFLRLIPVP